MGITYVGGNAELYGRGRYEFDELYCDGDVIVKGSIANAVDVVIKKNRSNQGCVKNTGSGDSYNKIWCGSILRFDSVFEQSNYVGNRKWRNHCDEDAA